MRPITTDKKSARIRAIRVIRVQKLLLLLRTKELVKNLLVHRLIKADDQCPALAQRRRAQIARAANQQLRQCGFIRLVSTQIQMNNVLAFSGVNFVNLFNQSHHLFEGQRLLFCAFYMNGFDFMLRKKLSRFGAGVSARAMVIPIDLLHRGISYKSTRTI